MGRGCACGLGDAARRTERPAHPYLLKRILFVTGREPSNLSRLFSGPRTGRLLADASACRTKALDRAGKTEDRGGLDRGRADNLRRSGRFAPPYFRSGVGICGQKPQDLRGPPTLARWHCLGPEVGSNQERTRPFTSKLHKLSSAVPA